MIRVKELIEALKEYPEDYLVLLGNGDSNLAYEVIPAVLEFKGVLSECKLQLYANNETNAVAIATNCDIDKLEQEL